MKITIEAHGRTYSAELEDDIGALNQAVRGLLVAVGYHMNTVDDYFPNWEDYQEGCQYCQPFISTDLGFGESYTVTFPEADEYDRKKKDELGEHFGI